MESVIHDSDIDAHALHIQLNNAMMVHDMKAVSRAMHDLAGIGYSIQIMTRHIAKNRDRLEITSSEGDGPHGRRRFIIFITFPWQEKGRVHRN